MHHAVHCDSVNFSLSMAYTNRFEVISKDIKWIKVKPSLKLHVMLSAVQSKKLLLASDYQSSCPIGLTLIPCRICPQPINLKRKQKVSETELSK